MGLFLAKLILNSTSNTAVTKSLAIRSYFGVIFWILFLVYLSYDLFVFLNIKYGVKFALAFVGLLVVLCYVMISCIRGAILEAPNVTRIVDGPSGVEMGQSGTEIIASSSLPYSWISWRLGVEMGKPTIDFNVEPSDPPPSYYQLFPTMEQSSK